MQTMQRIQVEKKINLEILLYVRVLGSWRRFQEAQIWKIFDNLLEL